MRMLNWAGVFDRKTSPFYNFFIAIIPTGLALSAQLVTFVILAKNLGPEQFGTLATIFALNAIFVEFVGLGGADLLIRATVIDKLNYNRYIGNTFLCIIYTLPAAVASTCLILIGYIEVRIPILLMVVFCFTDIAMGRVQASAESIMVGHREVGVASGLRLIVALLRAVTVIVFFELAQVPSLLSWMMVYSVQNIIMASLIVILIVARYGPPQYWFAKSELKDGVAFSVNHIARASQSNVDRIILANFSASSVVGVYSAASRLLQLGIFPIQVVTRLLYPGYFIAARSEDRSDLVKYGLKSSLILFVVGTGSGVCVSAASMFLPALVGSEYGDGTLSGIILSFSLPFIAMQYAAADVITAAGRQGLRAIIYVVNCCLFGCLLALAASLYGTIGVSAGYLGGQMIFTLLLWISAKYVLGKRN